MEFFSPVLITFSSLLMCHWMSSFVELSIPLTFPQPVRCLSSMSIFLEVGLDLELHFNELFLRVFDVGVVAKMLLQVLVFLFQLLILLVTLHETLLGNSQ
jgi:hypothetical protein